MRFNAPPGWTVPAPDWVPNADWEPDPSWPPALPGWQFFTDEAAGADRPHPPAPAGTGPAGGRPVVMLAAVGAVVMVALLGFFLVRFAVSKSDQGVSRAEGPQTASSTWTVETSSVLGNPVVPQESWVGLGAAITFEGMRDFVYRHYADLPSDPRATWDRLDSGFTARTNWSEYAGFWSTIQSVSVTSVQPDGPTSVIARLTLVPHRGNTSTETRRISFVSADGGLRISGSDRLG